jgi:hypothetical protein
MIVGVIPPSGRSQRWDLPVELLPCGFDLNEKGEEVLKPAIFDVIEKMVIGRAEKIVVPLSQSTANWLPQRLKDGGSTIGVPVLYTWSDGNWLKAIDTAHSICSGDDVVTVATVAGAIYKLPNIINEATRLILEGEADMNVLTLSDSSDPSETIVAWSSRGAEALRDLHDRTSPTVVDVINQLTQSVPKRRIIKRRVSVQVDHPDRQLVFAPF